MSPRRDFIFKSTQAVLAGLFLTKVSAPVWASSAWTASSSATPDSKKLTDVAKAAADCLRMGEACLAHCERELATGDNGMAKCSEKVHEMLAVTRAMLTLASMKSPRALEMASLCAEVCRNCADACAEHKEHFGHGMHLECKACMEACQACEKACNSLKA